MKSNPHLEHPPIIGLYSPIMGSGKTTVAQYLSAKHGYTMVSFASPIRRMLRVLLAQLYSPEQIYEFTRQENKSMPLPGFPMRINPRYLLQTLGTEWGRNLVHPDIWVKAAFAGLREDTKYVFDDMRFPNEFEAIQKRGGQVWCIERPGLPPDNLSRHSSERRLDGYVFHTCIVNHGSIQDLHDTIDDIMWRPEDASGTTETIS